jgi:hypothetical protein
VIAATILEVPDIFVVLTVQAAQPLGVATTTPVPAALAVLPVGALAQYLAEVALNLMVAEIHKHVIRSLVEITP